MAIILKQQLIVKFRKCLSVFIMYPGTKSLSHWPFIISQIVNERNVSLLFGDELDIDHCDVLQPDEERGRLNRKPLPRTDSAQCQRRTLKFTEIT
jgi:hypothetical protein